MITEPLSCIRGKIILFIEQQIVVTYERPLFKWQLCVVAAGHLCMETGHFINDQWSMEGSDVLLLVFEDLQFQILLEHILIVV